MCARQRCPQCPWRKLEGLGEEERGLAVVGDVILIPGSPGAGAKALGADWRVHGHAGPSYQFFPLVPTPDHHSRMCWESPREWVLSRTTLCVCGLVTLFLLLFPHWYRGLAGCGAIKRMWVTPFVPLVAMVGLAVMPMVTVIRS